MQSQASQESSQSSQPEIYQRSLDDVHSTIAHAKLEERNLTDLTQALYFPEATTDDSSNLKLLELNPHLLEHITEGNTLLFKGGLNENVVLCTKSKTFDLKEAEVSNSICLVPCLKFAAETSHSPLKTKSTGANNSADSSLEEDTEDHLNRSDITLERRDVLKIFQEYFEVREIQPRFRKLHDLLQMTRYSGPENEYCIERKLLFTRQQLLDTTQCSEDEFAEGLKIVRAIEIDQYMRVLEIEYEFRVIGLLLGVIDENSWALDAVDREESIAALCEIIPEGILRAVFAHYTHPSVNNAGKFTYIEEKVCRIMARSILKPGLKFYIDDFLTTWQETLPEGMKIDEKYLRGIGVIDRDSKIPCVRTLLETSLPTSQQERFQILFQAKQSWTLDEIEPYVECFTTPTVTVTSILNRFARSMNQDGQRVYLSKH